MIVTVYDLCDLNEILPIFIVIQGVYMTHSKHVSELLQSACSFPYGVHYIAAAHFSRSQISRITQMVLFHCMVRHGTVQYGSLLGGFPLGTVPGTWYFFSTTSAEVSKWSVLLPKCDVWTLLITDWPEKIVSTASLNLWHETQHRPARFKSAQPAKDRNFYLNKRTFCINQKNSCFVVCWGSTDVPLIDSWGAYPAWKSLMYILFALCIFLEYIFCLEFYLCICVLLQLKTIWSNKCTSRLY